MILILNNLDKNILISATNSVLLTFKEMLGCFNVCLNTRRDNAKPKNPSFEGFFVALCLG